jgi:hypothetical protein
VAAVSQLIGMGIVIRGLAEGNKRLKERLAEKAGT